MDVNPHDKHRSTVTLCVCIVLIICSVAGGLGLLSDLQSARCQIAFEHFIAVFGLPAAAAAAFIIVTLFRQGEEPIRINGLGFQIEGAAGPVVLWVLCFLAICGGIKLLW